MFPIFMKKYIVISPGRAASNSLFNHIHTSLDNLGIDHTIENLETPIIWMDAVEDPENWTVVISTRTDMLAQTLGFYTIMQSGQTHKTKNIELDNFKVQRIYFFAFAYSILGIQHRIFNYNNWQKFKKVYFFNYEDIVNDWTGTGQILGFNDWEPKSKLHARGYGRVWDKIINKEEVLAWAEELQIHNSFTFNKENYK